MVLRKNASPGVIGIVVEALCSPESFGPLAHESVDDIPMPSVEALGDIVALLRSVLFPGYFGSSELKPETMRYYVGATLDSISTLLFEQVMRGYCFACEQPEQLSCEDCEKRSHRQVAEFLSRLPQVRELLSSDVTAAYEGDPAAKSPGETIYCYPSIKALTNYRVSHELYRLGIPLIPRIITEMAHSETGIDIHPGADIGPRFFMDHGTGIVIGETCVIGENVRVYQGVTLGAKSFPLDKKGKPIKGIARHPIVEDEVIIYSGATILGRVTIGRGSVIGGNVWLTRSVPAGSRILQSRPVADLFDAGSGI